MRLPREAAVALRDAPPDAVDAVLAELSAEELDALARTWQLTAFASQLRPGSPGSHRHRSPIWVFSGGRGSGKTRALAERRLDRGEDYGPALRGLLASSTIGDVRDVMIEGESGMIACAERRGYRVRYIANRGLVEHPSGARWLVMTAEKPDVPRGKQSNDIWGDEFSSWKKAIEFFDNLMFGHRLPGAPCEADFSSTPKPNPITRRLLKDPKWSKRVAVTIGRSAQNFANLSPEFRDLLVSVYEGTRLGRQEMDGELLDDLGEVVDQATIDRWRVREAPELERRVVALDPAATSKEQSDDSGLVVVGSDWQEYPHAYVLADRTLHAAAPNVVAAAAVDAWIEFRADEIVYESNNGGEWIKAAIKAAADARGVEVPITSVWAGQAKAVRFEPIGALYEKGRVHHVGAVMAPDPQDRTVQRGAAFLDLEREASTWVPGSPSPNRLDALAHAVTHLLLAPNQMGPLSGYL